MAGAVPDGDEQRLVLRPRPFEGVVTPRVPLDGILGVLEEVWARRAREAVHWTQLTRHTVDSMLRMVGIVAVAAALVGAVAGSGLDRPGLYRLYPTSIEFSDETTGVASFSYACGEDGCSNAVGRTTDAGRTWTVERARPRGEWKPPIAFVTPRVAFTWEQSDRRSRLLRSDDAGTTWVEQTNPCARSDAIVPSFLSPSRGWMLCRIGGVGTQGDQEQAIFETRGATRTWRRIGGTPPVLGGIGLVPGVAWAWGGFAWRDAIFVPALGKLAWQQVFRDPTGYGGRGIESFHAVSADIAYTLFRRDDLHRSELRRTVNRGRSWTVVHKWSFAWAYRRQ